MNERIQFGEPIEPAIPKEKLPPDDLLAGSANRWREAPFQVYIVQEVYAKIWQHVGETPSIESGGVLLGHPFKTLDGQTTFIVVTGAIPQQSDNRSSGHFTVDTDEIRAARREIEQKHPGLVVVGWYHSHPGHGIFLSGQDMTIVRSIYDASWHIAMVIDPRRRAEGIFRGPEGRQIGGAGNRPLRESWIGLRRIPDSVKVVALYNQAKERLNENRPEPTLDLLNQIEGLVKHSHELAHWRDGPAGYRDIDELRARANEMPESRSLPKPDSEQKIEQHRPSLPEPARTKPRREQNRPPQYWWLALSALLAGVFAGFVFTSVFLIENWSYLVTLGWGILISFLAVVAGGYVAFSRERIETERPDASGRPDRLVYFAGERIMALSLIGLVLILWMSYGISKGILTSPGPGIPTEAVEKPETTSTQAPVVVPPSATSTSTNTPTPTSTPTLTPTDTSTPSSTPTDTPSPTFTPTWTPTATLTIEASPVQETTVPTATPVITSTRPITP